MAKKIEEDTKPVKVKKESTRDVFAEIDKLNLEATFLNENSLSKVEGWIDTGNYSLNACISKKLRGGGLPKGRVSIYIGPESSGKTLMITKAIANAQKADPNVYVAYFDTENALDEDTAKRLGCDTSRIKHYPVEVTEQCRNQIVKLLTIVEEKKMYGKVVVVIDSIGNLITAQEKKKIDEGNEAPDMGNRAKANKSMLRAITHAAAKAKCAVICSNHIYDDPAQLQKSALKKQAGGSGPLYMSSVIIQLAKKVQRVSVTDNKDANLDTTSQAKDINGLTLRAFITKNRFAIPFLETEMYLNFASGLNKYSGLLEMAESYGVLTKDGHRYVFDGENIGFYKNWKNDTALWERIITKLEPVIEKAFSFKNETDAVEEYIAPTDEEDLEEESESDEL